MAINTVHPILIVVTSNIDNIDLLNWPEKNSHAYGTCTCSLLFISSDILKSVVSHFD